MFYSCTRKILFIGLIGLLSGCFDKTETKSVEWFTKNDAERKETINSCNDNPGELSEAPNCKNALAAESKLSSGSLRKTDW
ncbi:EexN family lipoprotein [Xenorhabdus sp. KK7.4]|uniref:EexN family lipoprotein n=1 Tax=Xenorhabdus sp. KK7.4 TaxID=1851572 RepID=UPI000C060D74|nr:EexN family lipoprotein [Xenorhabdus sp. KK7.4]PHM51285.1 hypothetical protein Xekk_03858 [Xenorhabdus sp. KK7.4]